MTSTGNLLVATIPLPVEDSADARVEILERLRVVCEHIAMRSDRHPHVVPTMIASLGRAAPDETGYEGERPSTANTCLLVTRSAVEDIAGRMQLTTLDGELLGVPLGAAPA